MTFATFLPLLHIQVKVYTQSGEYTAIQVAKQYETGIKIPPQQMDEINLVPNKLYPKWNYDIHSRTV